MASASEPVEIVVCLGSSCYARGNALNLASIETYLKNHGLTNRALVTGCLCQDQCKQGPNLKVGGEDQHEVTLAKMRELLHGIGEGRR